MELDISTIRLFIANSLFGLAKYSRSLNYYQKIDNPSLFGQKYTGTGMCYQKLGLNDEAEKNYTEAIKTNSQVAETYFNFAVLRLQQKNPEAAKKLLGECLNIDKNFKDAKKLIQDIDNKGTSDWYKWWFSDNLKKKIFGGFLVTFIMISVILANLINLANLTVNDEFISQDEILGYTITIALLFLLLLFPSIKKMKFKDIEVEISLLEYDIIIPNLIPPKPMEVIPEKSSN